MILGLDVSTSVVGVCYLLDDGIPYRFEKIDLRKIDSDLIEKAKIVSSWFKLNAVSCNKIFVEDKLSGFSGGRTSQQTIMKLAAFNGMVSWISYSRFSCVDQIEHIHPSTIKATMKRDGLFIPKGIKGKDKKKFVAMFVRDLIPEFPYEETKTGNLKAGVDDISDAYCVARAGFLKFCVD